MNENEKLKKMIELKSDLISISAHQLRTSLSAMKWTFKMLIDKDVGDINPEQEGMLKKSLESSERMVKLVNEMISINHAEDISFKYNFDDIQIRALIEDVLLDFSEESYKKGVKLVFEKPKTKLSLVHIDDEKIRVVIQNLIENSIKYSEKGDKVFISTNQKDNFIEISVKDTGIGIPKNDQNKIFGKFFRASNAKKKEQVGSGLGLYTIKGIIEKHKGKIWFESNEEGTIFYFTIPLSE